MNLCVIPARGGSKRIPRKNIREFCGKPMIAWSIEAAKESGLFDRIVVSTDDDEIADVAEQFGAEVPFRRPVELSDDYAGTTAVISHAVKWCVDDGTRPDAVCCLYATAPFVQSNDLKNAYKRFIDGGWEFCFTATEFPAPIFRSFEIKESGGVQMFFPEHFNTRSQDLPTSLHDAGQFYWGKPSAWLNQMRIFERHSTVLELPRWRVHDIDTADDWKRAELVFNALRHG